MKEGVGTLEGIARFIGEALAPIGDRLSADALEGFAMELGVRLPTDLATDVAVAPALTTAQAAATSLSDSLPILGEAADALDPDDLASVADLVAAGAETIRRIVELIDAIKDLVAAARSAVSPSTAELTGRADEVVAELPGRLMETLILGYLDERAPAVSAMLPVFGVADDEIVSDPAREVPPHRHRRLHFSRLAKGLSDPAGYFQDVFGFGADGFDGLELFRRVEKLLTDHGHAVTLFQPPGQPPVLEAFLLRLVADDGESPPALRARLRLPGQGSFEAVTPIGGPCSFKTSTSAAFDEGIEFVLSPSGQVRIEPPTADSSVTLSAASGLVAEDPAGGVLTVIGVSGATRLTVRKFEVSAGFTATWDPDEGVATAEPTAEISVEELKATVDLGGGDSFLEKLSGGGSSGADVSVNATWSPSSGLRFTGSSSLEISIPAHVSIGPATIEAVYLLATFDGDSLPVEVSAAVRGELGPVQASVDRVGVTLTFSAPEGGGNLGPLALEAAFKPPTGVGLAVDGGGIKGGGYLYLDPDRGEYAGALELKFQDVIHLKAVGVLNTVLPNGSDGFSLILIITAEFTPIQLGFGFTLNGVGGLIGVNRTMLLDVLRSGVRDGTLNSILFPEDVVANAPAIIADLERVFPAQEGRFLVGPMAKLGWGSPSLITCELGILLEIPRPAFAIVGVLEVILPAEEVAILELHVAFVGVVDFDKKELTFDASIYDSKVVGFALTGDMALRLYWGDNANFLLSVGGFHPSYTPPPMSLPTLQRLAIVIASGNPGLSASAYFAVTSNTVQFGGRLDAYAGEAGFSVSGFVSLDTLINFDPFRFISELSAMVAAKMGSTTLFSVRLTFTLEGPTPWHADGKATFSVGLGFLSADVSVHFRLTVGSSRDTSLSPVPVLGKLEDALRAADSWRAVDPSNQSLRVTLREIEDEEHPVVHPFGALAVAQKVVPLNLAIERFGSQGISGGDRLSIDTFTVGEGSIDTESVKEQFAPAQFLDLSNAEKLSRPSFESFDAGLQASGGTSPQADWSRSVAVEHEVIYLGRSRPGILHRLGSFLFGTFLRANAVASSGLAQAARAPSGLGTPTVALTSGTFVIADETLTAYGEGMSFESETEAVMALRALVQEDPTLTDRLDVVHAFETVGR